MSLSTQPYKGARDFYPEDKRIQKYMFGVLRDTVEGFGYQEYDAPLLESFDIYAAKTGEEIVNEQLYSFEDKKGRKVAIRPEMTPSVSRMVAARRQELAYPLRLYSIPNLWRYERPQHGRLREHYQLNIDLFGESEVVGDHEVILLADTIMQAFGATRDAYEVRINSRKHMEEKFDELELSPEQKKAVTTLIDKRSKTHPDTFEALFREKLEEGKAGELISFLNDKGSIPDTVTKLMELLKNSGVGNLVYDRNLARGFDYYTDVVFEVFDKHPDNNRSMFGGGRYDGLVSEFGVEPLPTVGFGMGDVTLLNFLKANNLLPELPVETDAQVILIGDVYERSQKILNELRREGLNLAVDATDRKLDAKIKGAVKAGVPYALFIGEKELEENQFRLKDLKSGEEKQCSPERLVSSLAPRRHTSRHP